MITYCKFIGGPRAGKQMPVKTKKKQPLAFGCKDECEAKGMKLGTYRHKSGSGATPQAPAIYEWKELP